MIARGIALCLSLAMTSAALGDANVVLVCEGGNCNFGSGGSGTVDVMIEQTGGAAPVLLRYAQFDLPHTNPAGLAVSLPITHAAPTGEISPSGPIQFWDFSTQEQACLIPENCGFGHFIDDELPGALPPAPNVVSFAYIGDLSNPGNPNFGENLTNQYQLPTSGLVKIGELFVECTGASMHLLDVMNANEADPALGARVDHGFEPRVTWSANAGTITGGTAMIGCVGGPGANLVSSIPACDGSLARSANNTIRLTFDGAITAPAPGDLEIFQLATGGTTTGANLSANFSYTVEGGNVLKITETGDVLTHRTWIGISEGTWAGVSPFKVDYQVAVGDSTGDGRVLAADVLDINSDVPNFAAGDQNRRDTTGDNRILAADVLAANANVPSFGVGKPTGHTCNP